jgi:hypothetical protein
VETISQVKPSVLDCTPMPLNWLNKCMQIFEESTQLLKAEVKQAKKNEVEIMKEVAREKREA